MIRILTIAVAFLSMSLATSVFARADALDNWTAAEVIPTFGGYPDGMFFSSVTYGNARFVAVGSMVEADPACLQYSDDGVHWTQINAAVQSVWDLYDITYGNGVFVAVGWEAFSFRNIYHSTNGINWTSHISGIDNVYGVTYGGGLFVAVGDGSIYLHGTTNRNIFTSPDGVTWTGRKSVASVGAVSTIQSVAYGSGQFVAVDAVNRIYNSPNGITWTVNSNPYAGGVVSFGNGLFIIPGAPGTNLLSRDGLNWAVVTNNIVAGFGRVIYAHGTFMTISGPNLLTSTDATNWVQRSFHLPSYTALSALAAGDRNVLCVGYSTSSGSIPYLPAAYISDPLVSLAMNADSPSGVSMSGLTGASYRIDYLTQLTSTNWQVADTFALTNSPFTWFDPQATNAARFYRATLLP